MVQLDGLQVGRREAALSESNANSELPDLRMSCSRIQAGALPIRSLSHRNVRQVGAVIAVATGRTAHTGRNILRILSSSERRADHVLWQADTALILP